MFMTYEESVLSCADENDVLSYGDCCRLLKDHNITYDEMITEHYLLDERNVHDVLKFLGY